jgi:hypothetical protein
MKPIIAAALAVLALSAAVPLVLAQEPPSNQMMEQHHKLMERQTDASLPTMPGQDAFGAIQELVGVLEADPNTDWSKVNLEALRQHLIDMYEVTLHADTVTKPVDNGIEATVTGSGRTGEAIKRMVRAHAHQIDQTHLNGWSAKAEPLPNGMVLTVTSDDQEQVQHLRGLGFIGVMVSGSHHQTHHLAMSKGEPVHVH